MDGNNKKFRPIRFFCPKCEIEVWDKMNYDEFFDYTLKELMKMGICDKCILKEMNNEK